jgi:hypothetical protein
MSNVTPYAILASMFTCLKDQALNRSAYEVYEKTTGKGKKKVTKTAKRVKRDKNGDPVLVGGETVAVYRAGSGVELHMDHGKGNESHVHYLKLLDVETGTFTGKVRFEDALKSGLLKKIKNGKNAWCDFPA